jgi:hypothetical protein
MPNCIRLWDTLFSDEKRFDFLNFVAARIIIRCRNVVLEGDFAYIMESLQSYLDDIDDVTPLLSEAWEM